MNVLITEGRNVEFAGKRLSMFRSSSKIRPKPISDFMARRYISDIYRVRKKKSDKKKIKEEIIYD